MMNSTPALQICAMLLCAECFLLALLAWYYHRRFQRFAKATLSLLETMGEWTDRGLMDAVPDDEQRAAACSFADALGVRPPSIQATAAQE